MSSGGKSTGGTDGLERARRTREAVREIIGREFNDARAKIQRAWHWGGVGHAVLSAAEGAQALVESVPLTEDPLDWLGTLIPLLQERRAAIRTSPFDPDGYGLATYHAIIRDTLALYRACGGTLLRDETDNC